MTDPWAVLRAGPSNSLTDVSGIEVGHYDRSEAPYRTGTTAVIVAAGAVAAVDARGGAPATHETDLLAPGNLVEKVHGIVLTGGSSFGLAAAGGVMARLEEAGYGWPAGPDPSHVVPIVPAAAIFDLGRGGGFGARPDATFGYRAAQAASTARFTEGSVGAGCGAETGRLVGPPMKGGIGTASAETVGGARVGALVVLNAAGSPVDPASGGLFAAGLRIAGDPLWPVQPDEPEVETFFRAGPAGPAPGHTIIAVVATDVALSRPEAGRLATVAHDGLARAVRPVHTLFDGDTIFALSTAARRLETSEQPGATAADSARPAALVRLFEIGADCVARAIVHALLASRTAPGVPSYRDAFPSAFRVR